MKKTALALLAGVAGSLAATGAFAADVIVPMPAVVAPAAPIVTSFAGYVDIHYGIQNIADLFVEDGEVFDDGDGHQHRLFSGAGRGAYWFTPSLGLQLDAWYTQVWEAEDREDAWADTGVGAHLLYQTNGGLVLGLLASYGRDADFDESDPMFNVALEGAQTFGNFRLMGQVGYVVDRSEEGIEDTQRTAYAAMAATYYLNPGFSITGNAGIARWFERTDEDDNDHDMIYTFGGRMDYQIGQSPLSLYAGVQQTRTREFDGEDGGELDDVDRETTFFVGVRMLLGTDTLQANDAVVPFADLNPMYGQPWAAR